VFPLRDHLPHVLSPLATLAIVGLNALVWIFVEGVGTNPMLADAICRFGLIPGALLGTLPDGASLALGPYSCPVSHAGSALTVLTSMFLHGGWLHILGNMWFLWIFGDNVEDVMGHTRYGVFYILCGLAAAAAQVMAGPDSALPMVGASGAIGGVMGAYVILHPRVRVETLLFLGFWITTVSLPAWFMLGYWFLLQLLSGSLAGAAGGGVAFWAHVGGFGAGALLVLVFRDPVLEARARAVARPYET
jgi:rhomboid family protein